MDKIEELGQWLLANQSKKDSPEFQDKVAEYRLLRFQQKYQEASQLPDSDRKAMVLDRLRTEITNAGGTPELTQGPRVTQAPGEDELVEAPNPPTAPTADTSGADAASRFLMGGAGAATGTAASTAGIASNALANRSARVAGMQEEARLAAQARAAAQAGGAAPQPPSIVMNPAQARTPIPFGGPDAGRLAAGSTGTMPYNYGKSAGLTDIEAGRALDMTKNPGGVHDLVAQRTAGTQKVNEIAPGFRENNRYGGILTNQSEGGGPRQSFRQVPVNTPPPEISGPANVPAGGLQATQVSERLMEPKRTGLDLISDYYRKLLNSPTAEMAGKVLRRVAPPVAAAGAGLDLAEIEHELRKDAAQRDYGKIALKGAGALGGALSLIPHPATIAVGSGLGLGAAGLEYLKDQGYFD